MTRYFLLKAFKIKTTTFYDDGDPPAVPPVPPPPPPPPPTKTFTQEQVNAMLAENKKGLQKQNQELVAQLEQLRENVNLTAAQKEELDLRIQTLSQQHLTEQQKIALELDTTKKKLKTETEALANEANQWKGAFQSVMVQNAVLAGASQHKAANAEQLLDLVGNKAKVVQELDAEGKPTGKFLVKLPVKQIDPKTKQPVVVELDAIEAIGKMREDPTNANLFLFDGKAGHGGSNHPNNPASGGTPDFSKMTPAQYRQWRKDNVK